MLPITSDHGTYALILYVERGRRVQVGRWRDIFFEPGFYTYIGSAFGPGGLRARLSRHWRHDKALRWHVDYLRAIAEPVANWYSASPERLEHRWADTFDGMPGASAVDGFGCSDCRCNTHLFNTSAVPDLADFSRLTATVVDCWPDPPVYYNGSGNRACKTK